LANIKKSRKVSEEIDALFLKFGPNLAGDLYRDLRKREKLDPYLEKAVRGNWSKNWNIPATNKPSEVLSLEEKPITKLRWARWQRSRCASEIFAPDLESLMKLRPHLS